MEYQYEIVRWKYLFSLIWRVESNESITSEFVVRIYRVQPIETYRQRKCACSNNLMNDCLYI
jgi:hypothetical protein